MSKDEIFDECISNKACFSTVMRILGLLTMILGIYLFFSPIVNLLNYIPLVGGLLSGIVGFVIFLAAVLISIPLWILTVSIAWLVYHPKVGLILLGIGLVVAGLILFLGRNKDNPTPTAGSTSAHFLALNYWPTQTNDLHPKIIHII